jgi:hypothetical protein
MIDVELGILHRRVYASFVAVAERQNVRAEQK